VSSWIGFSTGDEGSVETGRRFSTEADPPLGLVDRTPHRGRAKVVADYPLRGFVFA
jgi:hypothetical protein